MRPSPALFARAMDRMGISPEDVVYVYASEGCAFAHRAYWTFAFGGYHDPRRVKLVQGSLDEWQICGGALDREAIVEGGIDGGDVRLFRAIELETDGVARPPRYVPFRSDNDGGEDLSVADVDGVLAVVDGRADDASTTVVVDARSAGRFHGRDPEPRPGLRGGHIPGSVNVPFMSLLDPNDVTRYRPMEEVRAIFVGAGIEPLGGGGRGVDQKEGHLYVRERDDGGGARGGVGGVWAAGEGGYIHLRWELDRLGRTRRHADFDRLMRYSVVPVDHTSASPLGYRRIFMVDLVKRRRFLLTRKENSVAEY